MSIYLSSTAAYVKSMGYESGLGLGLGGWAMGETVYRLGAGHDEMF